MANRGSFILFPTLAVEPPTPGPDPVLGWLTVSAAGIVGSADSNDTGLEPDYVPIVGTVTFTPTFTRPIRINSSGRFLAMATINARFDSNGILTYDDQVDCRLIAPQWTELSDTEWQWRANIVPGGGQSWNSFEVLFSGAPGDRVNLASFL